jgi:hypothetical protein
LKIRELIAIGRESQVFAEQEYGLLERIFEKYMDNETINRPKQENWANSELSPKLLNILNY